MEEMPEKTEQKPVSRKNQMKGLAIITGSLAFGVAFVAWFLLQEGSVLNEWTYAMFGILGLILLLAVVFGIKVYRQREPIQTDYYSLFVMGAIWMPLGIAMENYAFVALGIVFMAIGLKNKDKWRKSSQWCDLSTGKKKLQFVLLIVLSILAAAGIAFLLANQ